MREEELGRLPMPIDPSSSHYSTTKGQMVSAGVNILMQWVEFLISEKDIIFV